MILLFLCVSSSSLENYGNRIKTIEKTENVKNLSTILYGSQLTIDMDSYHWE